MKTVHYNVIYQPEAEGGYNVIVPAIPEICTFGETLEEAKAMALDAIKCFLESAAQHNEPFPVDLNPKQERISVSV